MLKKDGRNWTETAVLNVEKERRMRREDDERKKNEEEEDEGEEKLAEWRKTFGDSSRVFLLPHFHNILPSTYRERETTSQLGFKYKTLSRFPLSCLANNQPIRQFVFYSERYIILDDKYRMVLNF